MSFDNQYSQYPYPDSHPAGPAGGAEPAPWSVTDPIAFGFKRIFSRTWHVWIGLTLAYTLCLLVVPFAVAGFSGWPPGGVDAENITTGQVVTLIVLYILFVVVSVLFSAVLYTAALRETKGHEQTWKTIFRDVPYGRMFLAFIAVFAAMLVVYAIIGLLMLLASIVAEWLMVVVGIIAVIALIPVMFAISFAQIHILDGNSVGSAFASAWRNVTGNFWKVFGASILLSLAGYAVAIVTLGVGTLVLVPLATLGTVYIYRKITGENVVLQRG